MFLYVFIQIFQNTLHENVLTINKVTTQACAHVFFYVP
jgi:uncharacterized membrane protein YhfC